MKMNEWPPYQHIDEACRLLEEDQEDHDSVLLKRAQLHVDIANAKMIGRGRAR